MMKTTFLLGLLFFAALPCSLGQDAKGGQTLVDFQSTQKSKTEKKVPVTPAKTTSQVVGQRVTYGGYLTDLRRAENKRALFNLRAPIDPRKDVENVSYYPGTDKVQGIILFSVKF
jgi:hypothetical protein